MKLVCILFLCAAAVAQLPDAPQPQPKEAHFLTFRKSWEASPLRTNKQTFKAPIFILAQAGLIASMIVACRNPHSREDWHSEVPAVAGIVALDYMSERLLSETYATGPAVYGMIHYSLAARR